VLTFTIRDSPDCFINVSCWGGEQHVTCLASQFHIGHVGEAFFVHLPPLPYIVLNFFKFNVVTSYFINF